MANIQHYIFVDESGDPGKPFEVDTTGNKIPTGASLFYILTAIYLDSVKLKDYFTGKNKDLKKVIDKKYLYNRRRNLLKFTHGILSVIRSSVASLQPRNY